MATNWGSPLQSITDAVLRAYLLKFERDWGLQQGQQSREQEYADWVRRQQFVQQQEAPERKRAEAYQKWTMLNAQVQSYRNANQEPPQDLLAALDAVQKELSGVGVAQRDVGVPGGPAPAPGQGIAGTVLADIRKEFALPGAGQINAETAQKRVNSLAAAGYSAQQIFQIVGPEVWTAAGLPTQARPETVGIPGQRGEEGGLSRFLAPQGTQQIPTGQTVTGPLLPEVPVKPPKRIAIIDQQTGKIIGYQEVPADVEVRFVTQQTPQGTTLQPYDPKTGRPTGPPVTYAPGVKPIPIPRPPGAGEGIAAPSAVYGDWEILPPRTKAGESRYRNRRTGQVLSRSGATAILKQSWDAGLSQALGVPRQKVAVKPPLSRTQIVAEVQKLDRRIAQLESLGKDPNVPAVSRDRFQQEYDKLMDRRDYLMSLLAPQGR